MTRLAGPALHHRWRVARARSRRRAHVLVTRADLLLDLGQISMKVIGFVEGAHRKSGGVGLVGVPMIHQALAERGHRDQLVVAGNPIPSGSRYAIEYFSDMVGEKPRYQTEVLTIPAVGRWGFSPALIKVSAEVASADFVTLHSLYSFPVLAGYVLARSYRKPYGLWPHGVLAPVQRRISKGRKRIYDAAVGRRIMDNAAVLFFSAAGERDETRGLGLKAPSVVIPHGIDLQHFSQLPVRGRFRNTHLGGHNGRLILYLSRLNEKKGLKLLIDSAIEIVAAAPDAVIAIAGGAHPPSFGQQVADWASCSTVRDHIVITGLLDEAEKMEALSDADLFVLPSEAENFGFAMFEAMASRIPVVVSDTLNYATEVLEAGAGLTPPRDPAAFAKAIISLLQEPEKRRAMGQNGFDLAAMYSWKTCGRLIETAMKSILKQMPLPPELLPEYPA